MNEVIEIKVLDNYRIWIKFKDGIEKIIDFKQFIGKGITKDLLRFLSELFKRNLILTIINKPN